MGCWWVQCHSKVGINLGFLLGGDVHHQQLVFSTCRAVFALFLFSREVVYVRSFTISHFKVCPAVLQANALAAELARCQEQLAILQATTAALHDS